MSQQFLIKSPEKQRLAPPSPQPAPARSFRGKLPSPILQLQLQRTLGNRRVAQLIRARRLTPQGKIIGLQRKPTVGAADAQYEQEADQVARRVVKMPDAVSAKQMQTALSEDAAEEDKEQMLQTKPLAASITPFMQGQMENTEESEDKEMPLQARLSEIGGRPVQRQTVPEKKGENKPIQAGAIGSPTDSFEAEPVSNPSSIGAKGAAALCRIPCAHLWSHALEWISVRCAPIPVAKLFR